MTNRNGRTLLSVACEHGHLEIVTVLTRNKVIYHPIHSNKKPVMSPFIYACLNGHLVIARYLKFHYHSTNDPPDIYDGCTPIVYAIYGNHCNIVEFLLDNGIFYQHNIQVKQGILHLAIQHEKIDIVKLLIKKGYMHDYGKETQQSILSFACKIGNIEICEYLINIGYKFYKCEIKSQNILLKIGRSGKEDLLISVMSNYDFTQRRLGEISRFRNIDVCWPFKNKFLMLCAWKFDENSLLHNSVVPKPIIDTIFHFANWINVKPLPLYFKFCCDIF